MGRITNAVLAVKIDNINKVLEEFLIPEVKKNSEFRIKASVIMGMIALAASSFGAGAVYILTKIWGK